MDLSSGPGQDKPDPLRVSPQITKWSRAGLPLMGQFGAKFSREATGHIPQPVKKVVQAQSGIRPVWVNCFSFCFLQVWNYIEFFKFVFYTLKFNVQNSELANKWITKLVLEFVSNINLKKKKKKKAKLKGSMSLKFYQV